MTEEGWRYPPFIVVERGESLDEWQARIQPDFPTIVQVLSHLLERVHTLHGLGVIHRDLKPGNVLWRPGQHSWTLIDYGCAALSGALLAEYLSFTTPIPCVFTSFYIARSEPLHSRNAGWVFLCMLLECSPCAHCHAPSTTMPSSQPYCSPAAVFGLVTYLVYMCVGSSFRASGLRGV